MGLLGPRSLEVQPLIASKSRLFQSSSYIAITPLSGHTTPGCAGRGHALGGSDYRLASNLALLCHHHHFLKTFEGWTLGLTDASDPKNPKWRFEPLPPFGQEPDPGTEGRPAQQKWRRPLAGGIPKPMVGTSQLAVTLASSSNLGKAKANDSASGSRRTEHLVEGHRFKLAVADDGLDLVEQRQDGRVVEVAEHDCAGLQILLCQRDQLLRTDDR